MDDLEWVVERFRNLVDLTTWPELEFTEAERLAIAALLAAVEQMGKATTPDEIARATRLALHLAASPL